MNEQLPQAILGGEGAAAGYVMGKNDGASAGFSIGNKVGTFADKVAEAAEDGNDEIKTIDACKAANDVYGNAGGAAVGAAVGGPPGAVAGVAVGDTIGHLYNATADAAITNDEEKKDEAAKALNSTTDTAGGATLGALAAGPVGACAGASIGGTVGHLINATTDAACNDEEEKDVEALKAANETVGTAGGATIGGLVAGPVGAVTGAFLGNLFGKNGNKVAEEIGDD